MNSEQNTTQNKQSENEKAEATVFSDFFETIIKAMIFIVIVLCLLVKICTVSGDSMKNTLKNGEKLIISNLFYNPKMGDIVVFHDTGALDEFVVKRIIATGNKWIRIDFDRAEVYISDDSVFDQDELIDESGYVYLDIGRYKTKGVMEVYVPEGYLFVMGDNRNNSMDSRSAQIGLVDERSVIGKVILRFFPLDRLGAAN